MSTYTSKHSPNELMHGAKMPGVSTNSAAKEVAPQGGNTKGTKFAEKKGNPGKQVTQEFKSKPMKMPKQQRTS